MFKQIMICIVLTLSALLARSYAHLGLVWLWQGHDGLVHLMGYVLRDGYWASMIKETIAALVFTLGIVAVMGFGYWVVKKSKLSNSAQWLWGVWLVVITALLSR